MAFKPTPDRTITDETIGKILRKIYLDSRVIQSEEYFIQHTYTATDFSSLVTEDVFRRIVGFLPNLKYKGNPFVLSVAYNRKDDNYEIIAHNSSLNFNLPSI